MAVFEWAARGARLFTSGVGMRAQLIRQGIASGGVKVSHVAIQLCTSVVLARSLGPDGFGAYSFVLALVTLAVIPAHLGFPGFLVRSIAVFSDQQDLPSLKGVLRTSFATVAITAVGIAAVGWIIIWRRGFGVDGYGASPLVVAMLLIPLIALLETTAGALRGLGKVIAGQIPITIVRPALILVLTGLLIYILPDLTTEHVLVLNAVATAVAAGIGFILLRKSLPKSLASVREVTNTGMWIREALPFMLLVGAQVFNHYIDILMLGSLLHHTNVGLYRVAVQITDGLTVLLVALTTVITPHLARLHSRGDWRNIQRVLVNSHRVGVLLLAPFVVIFALIGNEVISLVFGAEYMAAATALTILTVGRAFYATVGYSGVALSMFGLASVATLVTGATAVSNVILNALLIPRFGIVGAAVATAISMCVPNILQTIWIKARFGVNVTAFGRS